MDLARYVLLCLIWGSTWMVIKIGYGGLGPFNVAALRIFISWSLASGSYRLSGSLALGTMSWEARTYVTWGPEPKSNG